MGIANIISLLSGVALFLFGMCLMGDGLKKVAGSRLELFLYRLSSNPIKGILLGTGITAVIQSSSATSVMVVGFVNSGMMKVRQAIGIVLGAILGTSITGWIICLSSLSGGAGWIQLLSTAVLTGIIAVLGIILRMFCKNQTLRHIGDILLGFAVLMYGMSAMSDAVAPLRTSEPFIQLLTSFSNPFLGILAGCAITCVLQSASAAVGILQALAFTGAVDFSVALPLIMGIAIGAAVPVLLSAAGATTDGKRTAFVYLLIDALGAAVIGILFYTANAFFRFPFVHYTMTTVSVALLNTLFRLLTVLLLAPCIPLLEKVVTFLFPKRTDAEEDTAEIDRLEERFVEHPAIAMEQSRCAMNSMARKTQANLGRAFAILEKYSEQTFQLIQEKEQVIDRYEDKLGTYLVKITQRELTHEQTKEISKFLHTVSDFERIADHAVNLSEAAREIAQKRLVFSADARRELTVITSAVQEIVHVSSQAFIEKDQQLALRVEPLEELIDGLCDEMKLHHVQRIQAGECTLTQGFVFNDLLTNLERIADHCSNIAVAMIELEMDSFDTHEYLSSLRKTHDRSFEDYFKEYRQRYSLD
ncbi:MAG: Na/Pi cotransporter family protein [Eubacteriales bacterium]|nr:Na/Pi cotransporter family protein [Eubacteriales bacterium]